MSAVFFFSCASGSGADTLDMKDGSQVKGVVVEDYNDRVILSTADGEAAVMKSDIRELTFDDEETNLIKLAEQAIDRRRYMDAVEYYSWALKINPDSKQAKDGLIFLQLHLYGKERSAMEEELDRKSEADRSGSYISSAGSYEEELAKAEKALARSLGMAIKTENGVAYIIAVKRGLPAYEAGLRRNDELAAVWGRLVGHMQALDIIGRLIDDSSSEIRCTIGRTINLRVEDSRNPFAGLNEIIGASFKIDSEGLKVIRVNKYGPAYGSGLKVGDIITAIDGGSTRYMPFKKVLEKIRGSDGSVKVSISRNTIIWKRD